MIPLLALLCFATLAGAGTTSPSVLIGRWGYTVLGHGNVPPSWFNWKTEAGTIEFTATEMSVEYSESADNCPSVDFCIPGDTYSVRYNAASNPDGTITVTGNPGPDQDTMRFAVSDDGKVAVIDGTTTEENAQMFILAVKLEGSYSSQVTDGDYYAIGYERDMLGEDSGHYRSVTNLTSMNGDGTYSMTGVWNGDGTIHTFPGPVDGTYEMRVDGSMLIDGNVTGYVAADGKVALFSNPLPTWGANDDFMSNIALRKGDRIYSTADVAGTWAITFFGDDAGTAFWSSFGIMTCDSEGACEAPLKVKHSVQGLIDQTVQIPVALAADGSFNGFYLTGNIPHYSGAMGKDANVMLFALTPASETDTDNRRIAVAVRCTACADQAGPSLTVSTPLPRGKVSTSIATVQGTATDSGKGDQGIARVAIQVNGGEEEIIEGATATGSDVVTWSKEVSLIQGRNTITVVAVDLKGNATTTAIPVTCNADLTGPTLRFRAPKSTLSARITLTGTASDRGGNDVAYVAVNGEIVDGATALGKGAAAWSRVLDLELGSNLIHIVAEDRLGNIMEKTITVPRNPDTLPPSLKVGGLRANKHYTVSPVTVSGTATDQRKGDNGIARIAIRVNGGEEQALEGAAAGKEVLAFATGVELKGGANTITVTAYDTQENVSTKEFLVYYDAP
jgi:hypothetical protein